MLILLPPSEGKAPPARRGRPVDPADLTRAEALTATRTRVLDALLATSARPDAAAVLGVGASLADEVARNTRLRELPARPAIEVYTGVLYAALDWASLPTIARRRAATRVLIASALWGMLRPTDRIAPYRLSMDVVLPGVGRLARAWRPALAEALDDAGGRGDRGRAGVIVDCRSQTYAAAWTPRDAQAGRTAAVRVWQEGPGGRTVVSHLAKHTRGLLARDLLIHGDDPRTVPELAEALSVRWDVEAVAPVRDGATWSLDVLTGP